VPTIGLYAKHDGSGNTGVGFGGGINFWGDRNGDNARQTMGRIFCVADVNSGTNISGALTFETSTAGTPSEKLRITSGGKVLVGDGSAITPSRNLDVRGSGHQQILIGSTNNAGASLMVDGQGGGDGSGGLYCTFEAASNGHLKIINYDSSKNIIFGVGSNVGGNESVVITSSGNIKLPDNQKIELGGSQSGSGDFYLNFDGTYATMHSGANQMNIRSNRIILGDNGGVKYIDCQDNGAVSIYHQSSGTAYEQIVTGRDHISIWGQGDNASSVSYIKFKADNGSHRASLGKMSSSNGTFHIKQLDNAPIEFYTNNTLALTIGDMTGNGGHLTPGVNGVLDLGSSTLRWNNVFVNDLNLSNESRKDTGGNDVDGTWGDWTLQEGEDRVFMINNRTGKKYSLIMKEE